MFRVTSITRLVRHNLSQDALVGPDPVSFFMAVLSSFWIPSSLALRKQDPLYNNSVYKTRGPSKAGKLLPRPHGSGPSCLGELPGLSCLDHHESEPGRSIGARGLHSMFSSGEKESSYINTDFQSRVCPFRGIARN
uniref:Uncharacterized protein n=1 Tax=Ailuropoda melanoleuca TaxID=9646 RepID=A0A7N5P0J7_AILME